MKKPNNNSPVAYNPPVEVCKMLTISDEHERLKKLLDTLGAVLDVHESKISSIVAPPAPDDKASLSRPSSGVALLESVTADADLVAYYVRRLQDLNERVRL